MKADKGDPQSETICIEREMKRSGFFSLENQFQRNIIVSCIISSSDKMNKKLLVLSPFFHNNKNKLHQMRSSSSNLEHHKRECIFSYPVIKLYNLLQRGDSHAERHHSNEWGKIIKGN